MLPQAWMAISSQKDILSVRVYSFPANAEAFGDFLSGKALSEKFDDFLMTRGWFWPVFSAVEFEPSVRVSRSYR